MLNRYVELHTYITAVLALEGKVEMLVNEVELGVLKMLRQALKPFDDVTRLFLRINIQQCQLYFLWSGNYLK